MLFLYIRACIRHGWGEKACKSTAFFWHDQIFSKENAKKVQIFANCHVWMAEWGSLFPLQIGVRFFFHLAVWWLGHRQMPTWRPRCPLSTWGRVYGVSFVKYIILWCEETFFCLLGSILIVRSTPRDFFLSFFLAYLIFLQYLCTAKSKPHTYAKMEVNGNTRERNHKTN